MPIVAAPRRPLILCVEDNKAYLNLRQAVLESNGYLVMGAASSAEALRVVRDNQISLVISDHNLGGTSGAELASAIRKVRKDLPVMLYSGTVPENMGEVSCFVKKGGSVEEFLAIVGDLIRRYWG